MKSLFLFSATLCMCAGASLAHAATPLSSFNAAHTLVATSSAPGNVYDVGATVVLTAPIMGDFSALGGTVTLAGPISGDALVAGGSLHVRNDVRGDLRTVAGTVDLGAPVGGDLTALAFTLRENAPVNGSAFIVAANPSLLGGSQGPAVVYGNNVTLGGTFSGNVKVVAWGHVTLADDTIIKGTFSYSAPEPATIPDSARLLGGLTYENASYLPDVGTSRILALISVGLFLLVRIVGALILAGLFAGLFPRFAEKLITRATQSRSRSTLLTFALGFAACIAGPVVILLLALTFVGLGLSLLLFALYALLAMLSFVYAGVVLGGLLARRFRGRTAIVWHDGVIGMAILSLVFLVPFVGTALVFIFSCYLGGALLQFAFNMAFPHDSMNEVL